MWRGSRGRAGRAVFWLDGRQAIASHIALLLDGRTRPGPQYMACHHCDEPACVRPDHLYWGLHADNMRDRMERGRTARGDRMPHQRIHGSAHPRARVTEDDVVAIRAAYRPRLGGELMRRYGLSQAALWRIVNRRSWRHVP